MGVETMWIVDPKTRTGRICVSDDWRSAMRLEVHNTPINVDLESLFSRIDAQAGDLGVASRAALRLVCPSLKNKQKQNTGVLRFAQDDERFW